MSSYKLRKPAVVRVPKAARFKRGLSHFTIRILTLFFYHAPIADEVLMSWKEFAKAISLQDPNTIYDFDWWCKIFDEAGSSLLARKQGYRKWEAIPIFESLRVSEEDRTIAFTFNRRLREWILDNSETFSWVPTGEQHALSGEKVTLAHILFCGLERLHSTTLRTLTYKQLADETNLDLSLPNDQFAREVRRVVTAVKRGTPLRVKETKIKEGRRISGYLFDVRRSPRPKPYLKLSTRRIASPR